MNDKKPLHIGYCISPHGYGHASRASAVMQALACSAKVRFEIVTSIPAWFFAQSLRSEVFSVHDILTDIGMVQLSPVKENLDASIRALNGFYPLADSLVDRVARIFSECDLVLCDIAPLGILGAKRAKVPSVLIENFTWDWIYGGYREEFPQFNNHIRYLRDVYQQVRFHIQAEPLCAPCTCDLRVAPVARPVKRKVNEIRQQLQVGPGINLVLMTMGGVQGESIRPAPLQSREDCIFLLPGAKEGWQRHGNIWYFPMQSDLYHPDLVAASDAVIGKVGYSTLAEVYQAGVPFGYVQRPSFRESGPLVDFINGEMHSCEIEIGPLCSGEWAESLDELLALPKSSKSRGSGAAQVADFLLTLV